MMLDSSVMNVSMATVAKDLDTTVTGIQTAITLYTLVMASFMIFGGLCTTYLSWRYVFAGEVLGVVAILLFARRMEEGERATGVRLDLVGTALSALGLGLIVFGVLRSGTWGLVQPKPDAPEWFG